MCKKTVNTFPVTQRKLLRIGMNRAHHDKVLIASEVVVAELRAFGDEGAEHVGGWNPCGAARRRLLGHVTALPGPWSKSKSQKNDPISL